MRIDSVPLKPHRGNPQIDDGAADEHHKARLREALLASQPEPTKYTVPKEHQKWRAMNLFTLHYRYLGLHIPESYYQAIACVIEHANPNNGRSDTSQRKMAAEIGITRETMNRAISWWTKNTKFLHKDSRVGTSAYHPQWDAIEAEYERIQACIKAAIKGGCDA